MTRGRAELGTSAGCEKWCAVPDWMITAVAIMQACVYLHPWALQQAAASAFSCRPLTGGGLCGAEVA